MFKWIDQSESLRSFYIQNQAVKVMPVGKELPEPNCQVCSESNSPVIIEGNF